jgi:hypothetical protein
MTSHSDKLRIAVKLFEEEGAAMVNMINQGEAGLRNLERQAQQLGRTMSGEDLARVEAFNDALNRLSTLAKGFGGRIVIDLAPKAEAGINALTEAMQGAKLGSGRNPKTGEGFMRRNFRWTFGAADWLNKSVIKPQTDRLINRDIKNNVAMGSAAPEFPGRRGTANRMAREPGFFTPTEIQRARDNLGRHRFVTDGIKQMKEGYHTFFNESVKGFFDEKDKFLKDARKSLSQWQRAAMLDILTRPKLKPPEEKEKETAGPVSRSANSALIKGTIEAYQAVRANLVPKEQLAETRKQTGILGSIRDKLAESGPMMLVARI